MRRISQSRQKHYELYIQSKKELTAELLESGKLSKTGFPLCERCNTREGTDFHHKAQRFGALLWYKPMLCWLCRKCHTEVHENPRQARKEGWLVDLTQEQRNAIRDEALKQL